MNSCEHVKKALVDHGLDAIHRDDALAAHLQDCPACQQLLEAWSQIPDLLDQLPEHEPNEALLLKVSEAVASPGSSRQAESRGDTVQSRRRFIAPSLASAAVLLAAIGLSRELLMQESPMAQITPASQRAAGELLRLRTDGHGVRLTYKGPPSYEDGVKVRTELETTVASAASLEAILTALGYSCVRRYQKYREEWQLDGVIVALDRTPMGTFVEFEGEGAVEVALRCECDLAEALEADYLALYDAFRRRHPAAPADMVFDTAGPEDG